MSDAAPRTTKFLVELVGDLETVNGICSRCPEGLSLEEIFEGWEPTPNAVTKVLLVAHQDMAAEGAALLLALILEDILDLPARDTASMQMRVTMGSDVQLSLIEDCFRLIADCAWAKMEITSAREPVIPVETTNMSELIKQAIAQSRAANS